MSREPDRPSQGFVGEEFSGAEIPGAGDAVGRHDLVPALNLRLGEFEGTQGRRHYALAIGGAISPSLLPGRRAHQLAQFLGDGVVPHGCLRVVPVGVLPDFAEADEAARFPHDLGGKGIGADVHQATSFLQLMRRRP